MASVNRDSIRLRAAALARAGLTPATSSSAPVQHPTEADITSYLDKAAKGFSQYMQQTNRDIMAGTNPPAAPTLDQMITKTQDRLRLHTSGTPAHDRLQTRVTAMQALKAHLQPGSGHDLAGGTVYSVFGQDTVINGQKIGAGNGISEVHVVIIKKSGPPDVYHPVALNGNITDQLQHLEPLSERQDPGRNNFSTLPAGTVLPTKDFTVIHATATGGDPTIIKSTNVTIESYGGRMLLTHFTLATNTPAHPETKAIFDFFHQSPPPPETFSGPVHPLPVNPPTFTPWIDTSPPDAALLGQYKDLTGSLERLDQTHHELADSLKTLFSRLKDSNNLPTKSMRKDLINAALLELRSVPEKQAKLLKTLLEDLAKKDDAYFTSPKNRLEIINQVKDATRRIVGDYTVSSTSHFAGAPPSYETLDGLHEFSKFFPEMGKHLHNLAAAKPSSAGPLKKYEKEFKEAREYFEGGRVFGKVNSKVDELVARTIEQNPGANTDATKAALKLLFKSFFEKVVQILNQSESGRTQRLSQAFGTLRSELSTTLGTTTVAWSEILSPPPPTSDSVLARVGRVFSRSTGAAAPAVDSPLTPSDFTKVLTGASVPAREHVNYYSLLHQLSTHGATKGQATTIMTQLVTVLHSMHGHTDQQQATRFMHFCTQEVLNGNLTPENLARALTPTTGPNIAQCAPSEVSTDLVPAELASVVQRYQSTNLGAGSTARRDSVNLSVIAFNLFGKAEHVAGFEAIKASTPGGSLQNVLTLLGMPQSWNIGVDLRAIFSAIKPDIASSTEYARLANALITKNASGQDAAIIVRQLQNFTVAAGTVADNLEAVNKFILLCVGKLNTGQIIPKDLAAELTPAVAGLPNIAESPITTAPASLPANLQGLARGITAKAPNTLTIHDRLVMVGLKAFGTAATTLPPGRVTFAQIMMALGAPPPAPTGALAIRNSIVTLPANQARLNAFTAALSTAGATDPQARLIFTQLNNLMSHTDTNVAQFDTFLALCTAKLTAGTTPDALSKALTPSDGAAGNIANGFHTQITAAAPTWPWVSPSVDADRPALQAFINTTVQPITPMGNPAKNMLLIAVGLFATPAQIPALTTAAATPGTAFNAIIAALGAPAAVARPPAGTPNSLLKPILTDQQASDALTGMSPGAYFLRTTGVDDQYRLSFVVRDNSVQHYTITKGDGNNLEIDGVITTTPWATFNTRVTSAATGPDLSRVLGDAIGLLPATHPLHTTGNRNFCPLLSRPELDTILAGIPNSPGDKTAFTRLLNQLVHTGVTADRATAILTALVNFRSAVNPAASVDRFMELVAQFVITSSANIPALLALLRTNTPTACTIQQSDLNLGFHDAFDPVSRITNQAERSLALLALKLLGPDVNRSVNTALVVSNVRTTATLASVLDGLTGNRVAAPPPPPAGINSHPLLAANLSNTDVDTRLNGKPAGSFLLRSTDNPAEVILSVVEDVAQPAVHRLLRQAQNSNMLEIGGTLTNIPWNTFTTGLTTSSTPPALNALIQQLAGTFPAAHPLGSLGNQLAIASGSPVAPSLAGTGIYRLFHPDAKDQASASRLLAGKPVGTFVLRARGDQFPGEIVLGINYSSGRPATVKSSHHILSLGGNEFLAINNGRTNTTLKYTDLTAATTTEEVNIRLKDALLSATGNSELTFKELGDLGTFGMLALPASAPAAPAAPAALTVVPTHALVHPDNADVDSLLSGSADGTFLLKKSATSSPAAEQFSLAVSTPSLPASPVSLLCLERSAPPDAESVVILDTTVTTTIKWSALTAALSGIADQATAMIKLLYSEASQPGDTKHGWNGYMAGDLTCLAPAAAGSTATVLVAAGEVPGRLFTVVAPGNDATLNNAANANWDALQDLSATDIVAQAAVNGLIAAATANNDLDAATRARITLAMGTPYSATAAAPLPRTGSTSDLAGAAAPTYETALPAPAVTSTFIGTLFANVEPAGFSNYARQMLSPGAPGNATVPQRELVARLMAAFGTAGNFANVQTVYEDLYSTSVSHSAREINVDTLQRVIDILLPDSASALAPPPPPRATAPKIGLPVTHTAAQQGVHNALSPSVPLDVNAHLTTFFGAQIPAAVQDSFNQAVDHLTQEFNAAKADLSPRALGDLEVAFSDGLSKLATFAANATYAPETKDEVFTTVTTTPAVAQYALADPIYATATTGTGDQVALSKFGQTMMRVGEGIKAAVPITVHPPASTVHMAAADPSLANPSIASSAAAAVLSATQHGSGAQHTPPRPRAATDASGLLVKAGGLNPGQAWLGLTSISDYSMAIHLNDAAKRTAVKTLIKAIRDNVATNADRASSGDLAKAFSAYVVYLRDTPGAAAPNPAQIQELSSGTTADIIRKLTEALPSNT